MTASLLERRPWLVPLLLAALTVVLLRPAIWGDGVLNANDFRAMFYPLTTLLHDLVQAGHLPLWNPYTFIGHPLIGNPHSALFYPATWLIALVGADRGLGWALAFHVWWAAWGMARLTRSYGATPVASLLAGVVFAMSEWVGARFYAGHYTLLFVFAWIPWAAAAYRHALARGTWRSALPGMMAVGAATLAGHPPMLFYLLLTLGLLAVYQVVTAAAFTWGVIRQTAQPLLLIVIGGLLLGAALIVPALELTRLSVRSANELDFINSFALPPAQLLAVAVPGLFGLPTQPPARYWGADFYEEFSPYVGLLPLLALPLAWRTFKREHVFFLLLIAFGLVMSLGLQGALLPLLVRWVPGFSFFRAPGRALFFVMFGLSGMLALLVTQLQQSAHPLRGEWLRPLVERGLPLLIGVAFLGSLIFSGWYASASHVEPMPYRAFALAGALGMVGLISCGAWLILWGWTKVGEGQAATWLLLATMALVILDAWRLPVQLITTTDGWRDALWQGAAINVPTGADARVVQIPTDSPYNGSYNTGHLHVIGYDPLTIATFDRLQNLTDMHDPLGAANTLLGVQYALTKEPYDRPNMELIGIAPGGIYYRRTDPFPRAWIASTVIVQPDDAAALERIKTDVEALRGNAILDRAVDCPAGTAGEATISEYQPNSVVIQTAGAGGVLVLSDQYYPGWQATLDGQPVETLRAFTAFRAVCVPPGEHTVRFDYRPLSLVLGVAVSALGWLLVMGVWVVVGRRR